MLDQYRRTELADELGELDRQEALWKIKVPRLKALKDEIIRRCGQIPPDQACTVEGAHYVLNVSPRENQRKPTNIPKLFKAVGATRFIDSVSVSLKAVEAMLRSAGKIDMLERFTCQDRTGPRTVTAVLKQTPAA